MIHVCHRLTHNGGVGRTIQVDVVREALTRLGHATNHQLHQEAVRSLPRLSIASVHRITARLVDNGQARYAPSDGRTVVLDANPDPHDHFRCTSCGGMFDIALGPAVVDQIQTQLGRNIVRDGITVHGCCEVCAEASHPNNLRNDK